MPVWIRRVLFALLGLVVVLAALATWLVATFDANRYKGVAIEWMKTHRDRTLTIDGPVELSVFPRLAVTLSKVRLSEPGGTEEFAALEEASLAAAVLPLLRGELVVGHVQAKGVSVSYLRDANGHSNIDDLLQANPAETAEPSGRKPVRVDINRIDLADVRVRVKDAVGDMDGELLLSSLTTGRLADKVETNLALNAQFDFKSPRLKGALQVATQFTPDLDRRSAGLRDTTLDFKGDAPGASGLDANLTFERFAFDAEAKSLTLRQLTARLKLAQDGRPLALELAWPELAASRETLSGSAFSGKVSLGGEMPLEATFKSGAPSGNFDAIRLPGVEATIASHTAARRIDGTLRADLTLRPTPVALEFEKLTLSAKVGEPKQPPLTLVMNGRATASALRSSWNLNGQLNANAFSSDGTVTSPNGTQNVVARARFDALDLNRLLPPTPSAPTPSSSGGADAALDLSALRLVDGQFNLQAGQFTFKQYRVADARLAATLNAGLLRVTELRGKAWGGTVDATAQADARSGRMALKGVASGVNVNALVKDVAAKDWIEGTGNVSVDIGATGRSVNALKSQLQGSAALQLRDGAIKGINLAQRLRQAKAALAMRQDAVQAASQTEKTDFSALSVSFQIADGVARSRDLDLKSPFLRLGGEGAIDVGRSRIDYLARATVAATAAGQGGAELAALKGLTVPVRLSGPFDALGWKIEWSSVVKDAVTNQLKDKLSERLGLKPPAGAASGASAKPEDLLKNKLKGLFR